MAIIGSGPAGISIASALIERGHKNILLIESGLMNYDAKQNKLGKIKAEGDLDSNYFQQHNLRLFGGASAVWGGFCAIMDERGFLNDEWPFKYSELTKYYPPAAKILELPEESWKTPSNKITGTNELIYKPFYLGNAPVRFGKKYLDLIQSSSSVDLLIGHTVTNIKANTSKVESLDVADSSANRTTTKVNHIVLACGGINNPRLLQLSGINNDMIGRCLMEHPHVYGYGRIIISDAIIKASREATGNRVDALRFTDDLCHKTGLLSFSVSLDDGRDNKGINHEGNNLLELGVSVRSEMHANKHNRVTLNTDQDWLQQPGTTINFNFNYDKQMKNAWRQLGASLLRGRLGRLTSYIPDFKITGGGHMIGTTRMGKELSTSCVDANAKVHGLDNLYIAGSSIFPAGGASNPTYTIVALSIRLAEHLSPKLTS